LIEKGWAYYAFDSAEKLDELRKQAEAEGKTFIYNHTVREQLDNSLALSKEEVDQRIANGDAFVVRFKTPTNEILELKDIIRGTVKFDTNLLDDKVLYKSDGMPTYHLANIVDDHLMETSHVIRGEEWLPSLPLHHLLYKAFGWEAPEFAHLPLILKPVGNGKLSKRDGDKMGFPVFPLEWKTEESTSMGYREQGYFPEAVVNFLALLGWNDGTDKELFSLEELVASFDLTRVNKSGAKFDPDKNKWFNHQYLVQKSDEELAILFAPIVKEKGIETSLTNLTKVVGQVKERANFVTDLWDLADYFFVAPTSYDEKVTKKWNEETKETLTKVAEQLNSYVDFTSLTIENSLKEWMTANEIGMGKVMQPLRLSLVGELKGPHLFDIIEMIGKEETIK
ncbi:MAG: glutamate--tRNA ligase, partial [Flavobacteriaceae bacterium]|nr:glutamate--tRNA ligase [Flavobacteriaceae bacterium]